MGKHTGIEAGSAAHGSGGTGHGSRGFRQRRRIGVGVVVALLGGLLAGTVSPAQATEEADAAPAVAERLLDDAGIDARYGRGRGGGNHVADVADRMAQDQGTDFDRVPKDEVEAYECAVAMFLRSGEVGPPAEVSDTACLDTELPVENIVTVSAGGFHTCAVTDDGIDRAAWCWGHNFYGQLGHGSSGTNDGMPVPVRVAGGESGREFLADVVAISAGRDHSCAVTDDGIDRAAWCWGYGRSGQLGNGTATDSAVPVRVADWFGYPNDGEFLSDVVAISAGWSHSCAVTDDGMDRAAFCWGNRGSGQLGDNSVGGASWAPVRVAGEYSEGVYLDRLTDVVTISAGRDHSCAVTDKGGDRAAWCWGSNDQGQIGAASHVTNSSVPVRVAGGESGDSHLSDVVAVAAGMEHTCAATDDGHDRAAWCWGNGSSGLLGKNAAPGLQLPVRVAGGESGGEHLNDVVAISADQEHSCAVTDDGSDRAAWCWGQRGSGRLGNGTATGSVVPVRVVGGESGAEHLNDVVAISAGGWHSCAVTGGDGERVVWCWGNGQIGQLGNGGTGDSAVPVQVEGLGEPAEP